ncbi:acetyl-CoA synthetase-like protein [Phanerochaete sordida]|uniref:Acetyl-CoA synthetase-like protein n=1 Tax=Phanerochaete sordida TaxID=48140 RepID=A0A9P3GEP9_9APHY|nr:acetyl-CoA synthetase-like protein [Phanerochaete sordida]
MDPNRYMTLPIPPLPRTQALTTTTFRPPPLDGSVTLPEMWDWHASHSPAHPLFSFADDQGAVRTILWPEAVRACHRAARRTLSSLKQGAPRAVVAILAACDTTTYFTMEAGIIRSGHVLFPISPRNSAAAVAHLLAQTCVAHVFVGAEPALQDLARAALELMDRDTARPTLSTVPAFEELYADGKHEPVEPLPPYRPQWDDPALIMHSSGSTAFPKPIVWSHYRYFMLCIVPYLGEWDMTGVRLACHSMPMFHGMGIAQTGWTATAGLIVTAFKPQVPAVAPTPELVLQGALNTESDVIFCVPSFVEAWAKSPEDVDSLRQIMGVLYGGGPLSEAVGNSLVDQGVGVYILYGCSEAGILSPILPNPGTVGRDWQYFRFPEGIETHFVPDGNGRSELVLLPGKFIIPNILNTTINGKEGYATSDLLEPHPTRARWWKVYGRVDDQIMHNTGEKTNPGPLESILNQDPHVHAAVMFGRGRFNAGILIDPKPAFRLDPADREKLAEFRNKIWPTVERMNDFAPQHSRIFKEMIIAASPSKPFTYTAKNTARRQAVIDDYEPEIDAAYAAVEESTQPDLPPPPTWDFTHTLRFVRVVVNRVLKNPVSDTDDIFQKGCDSLQATWIRNSILHALRDSTKSLSRALPNSFVYQHPTIVILARFISGIYGVDVGVASGQHDSIAEMHKLVEKYSAALPTHVPSLPAPTKETVLLTGSTGALGAELLALLVTSSDVLRIYAVNRKGRLETKERQRAIMLERGLDPSHVDSPKIVFADMDMTADGLGLPTALLEEMRASLTHIIHNAWPVNFNMALQSFEPAVKSVRTLVDLALGSPLPNPPNLLFVSSVSVLYNVDPSSASKEELVGAEVAVGIGYSESKWVSEQVLARASSETPLRATSVRVGQISGGSSGVWNTAEWFPALVKSSVLLQRFPALDKVVTWVPISTVARTLLEMRSCDKPILHLAHPRSIPWTSITKPIADELQLPLVPYDEWLGLLLRASDGAGADDIRQNPALKLLDFFEGATKHADAPEAMGLPLMDVSVAVTVSPSLRDAPTLVAEDALRWLRYWKQVRFIS